MTLSARSRGLGWQSRLSSYPGQALSISAINFLRDWSVRLVRELKEAAPTSGKQVARTNAGTQCLSFNLKRNGYQKPPNVRR